MTDSENQAAVMKELTERLIKQEKSPPVSLSATHSQQIEKNRLNPKKPDPIQHKELVAKHGPIINQLKSVLEKRGKVN